MKNISNVCFVDNNCDDKMLELFLERGHFNNCVIEYKQHLLVWPHVPPMVGSHFEDTRFVNARFANALNCSFQNCTFVNCYATSGLFQACNFSKCDMTGLYIDNHCGIEISQCITNYNPGQILKEKFEFTEDGMIAYKIFGLHFPSPGAWKIEPGSVIRECGNTDIYTECGSGISMATMDWISLNGKPGGVVWKMLIPYLSLVGVIVPYKFNGKIRACNVDVIIKETVGLV